jgi:hypothetical protein
MKRPGELRSNAKRYREMSHKISDHQATEALRELAAEFEATADEIEKSEERDDRWNAIRERAYLIWIEEGRPEGRDLKHWAAAEREFHLAARDSAPRFTETQNQTRR